MQTPRNKHLLYNWVFILCLILLALNDHYFKWQYSNWVTGKISDFTGLLILPLFLAFLFPSAKHIAALLSGLFFIFWKLPVSENFISTYNQIALVPIIRTIDYTDFIALLILPLPHLLINRIESFKIIPLSKLSIHPVFIIVPASLVFMATSMPISYYMKANGDVHIGKYYKLKISKEEALKRLNAAGFTVKRDTAKQDEYRKVPYYTIENAVLSGGKDTIRSIQFGFKGEGDKTMLLLNNVNLSGDRKISDWKELKRYSKYYKKLIHSAIIEEIK